MIDPKSVESPLHEIANEIRTNNPAGARRLDLLARAIVNGNTGEADTWTSVDIHNVIDPESIVEHYRRQHTRGKFIDFLEILRNMLIFGPILVTWTGISQASASYNELLNELLKSHPDQVSQPFLYLWQQGFGGKLPWFLTLSSIGLIDVVIIAIIILLTFFTFWLTERNEKKTEQETQDFRASLMHALAGASLYFHNTRRRQQLAPGENLATVAQNVDEMTRQTMSSLQALVEASLRQFNETTRQITDSLNQTTGQMTRSLNETINQALGWFRDISARMGNQLTEGDKYLASLKVFVAGLDKLSQDMNESARALVRSNGELTTGMNNLLKPVNDLADQQQKLVEAAQDSVIHLEKAASTLTDLGKKQELWGTELSGALDDLNMTIEKAALLATDAGNLMTKQKEFLEKQEKQYESQRNLASLTSDATVSLKDALGEIKVGATSLRSIARDMYDLVNLQRSSNVTSVVESYSNAAQIIEQSGNSLSASAVVVYETSQRLADLIYDLEKRLTTIK